MTEDQTENIEAGKYLPQFLHLYNSNYRRMFLYAKTLIPTGENVEDVLQEASLAMWTKFPRFRQDSDFLAWAFGMIRIEILRLKRRNWKNPVYFDEEYLELVGQNLAEKNAEEIDLKLVTLQDCSQKLPPKFRQLILDRYFEKLDINDIARKTKKTVAAVYQLLSRARMLLKDCVSQKMQ